MQMDIKHSIGLVTAIASDFHLGRYYCRIRTLLPFMRRLQCNRLVINGDGIDLIELPQWALPSPGANFVGQLESRAAQILPPSHYAVLQTVRIMAESGIDVIWVAGNHDAEFRNHFGEKFFGATLVDRVSMEMPDGKKALITHGDQFDVRIHAKNLHSWMWDRAFFMCMRADVIQNAMTDALKLPRFSLPKFLRRDLGIGQSLLNDFRARMTEYAAQTKHDVIMCGHIHEPEDASDGHVRRINSGDFTESNSFAEIGRDGEINVYELPPAVKIWPPAKQKARC